MQRMNTVFAQLALAGLSFLSLPTPVRAAMLLNVTGPTNTGTTLTAGQAAAVAFTLNQAVTNFTISAPLLCLGCTGSILLHANVLGSTAVIGDSLGAIPVTTSTPFFSLPSLATGTYFLVISVDSGTLGWQGTTAPTVVQNGATRLPDLFAATSQPFPAFSTFALNPGVNLNYTVTGILPTPEPGTLFLIVPLAGLMFVRQFSRSTTRPTASPNKALK